MGIRVVPTRTHGVIDHVTGSTLVWGSTLLGMDNDSVSTRASRLAGGGATAYSLVTDYELGARRILPMPAHLALDAVSGALLAATPWVAGEAERGTRYWLPHALIGGTEIVLAAITQPAPAPETLSGKLARKAGVTGAAKLVAKAPGSPQTKAKLLAKTSKGAGKAGKLSANEDRRTVRSAEARGRRPGLGRRQGRVRRQARRRTHGGEARREGPGLHDGQGAPRRTARHGNARREAHRRRARLFAQQEQGRGQGRQARRVVQALHRAEARSARRRARQRARAPEPVGA